MALLTPSVVVEEGERETVRGRGREQERRERRDRSEEAEFRSSTPKKTRASPAPNGAPPSSRNWRRARAIPRLRLSAPIAAAKGGQEVRARGRRGARGARREQRESAHTQRRGVILSCSARALCSPNPGPWGPPMARAVDHTVVYPALARAAASARVGLRKRGVGAENKRELALHNSPIARKRIELTHLSTTALSATTGAGAVAAALTTMPRRETRTGTAARTAEAGAAVRQALFWSCIVARDGVLWCAVVV